MVFQCPFCDRSFVNENGRNNHQDALHPRAQRFRSQDALENHQEAAHPRLPFNCDQCSCDFETQENLKEHTKDMHPLINCDKCSSRFKTQESLSVHTKENHPVLFHCGKCPPRRFKTQEALAEHTEAAHTRPFNCEQCSVRFKTRKALVVHTKENHGAISCEQCSRGFRSEAALENHSKDVHGAIRCDQCPRGFRSQEALEEHTKAKHHVLFNCGEIEILRDFEAQENLEEHKKAAQSVLLACEEPACKVAAAMHQQVEITPPKKPASVQLAVLVTAMMDNDDIVDHNAVNVNTVNVRPTIASAIQPEPEPARYVVKSDVVHPMPLQYFQVETNNTVLPPKPHGCIKSIVYKIKSLFARKT